MNYIKIGRHDYCSFYLPVGSYCHTRPPSDVCLPLYVMCGMCVP